MKPIKFSIQHTISHDFQTCSCNAEFELEDNESFKTASLEASRDIYASLLRCAVARGILQPSDASEKLKQSNERHNDIISKLKGVKQ